MPTQEELKTVQETLETRRQIEEIIGTPVGTVKTDFALTDDEYEKIYTEMCENESQKLEKLKKHLPIYLLISLIILAFGIVFLVFAFKYNDYLLAFGGIGIILIGIFIPVIYSPKRQQMIVNNLPSKEEYFDSLIVLRTTQWLEEAKKNNYYFDLQEQALIEKVKEHYGRVVTFKCPKQCLLVGSTEFTALRRNDSPVINCISFQIENISGIAIRTQVHEESKSTHTENKIYNNMVERFGSGVAGKKYTTETETSRTTEYLVSLSFTNRVNPYSFYIGTNENLLLSVVNIFERLTGLQAIKL